MGADEACPYEGGGSGSMPEEEAVGSESIPEENNLEKQSKKKQKRRPVVVEERQVNTTDFGNAETLNDTLGNSLRDASDDEEECDGKRKKKVRYRPFKLTNECPKWEVRGIFGDREHIRDAVRQYAVMRKRPIKTAKNDGKRYKFECPGRNCEWFVTFAKMTAYNPNDFVVYAFQDKHSLTCTQVTNNKWISARWLGKRYTEKIKFNPRIPLGSILQCVDEDFSSKFSRNKAYRARTIALEGIYGTAGAQYGKLFQYKEELLRTHPESTVDILYEGYRETGLSAPRFVHFYCCLGPLKNGWKQYCRPIIFLDACFLRGMYWGQVEMVPGSVASGS